MLIENITGSDLTSRFRLVIIDWKNPVFQTLSIKMNIEAKNTNVYSLLD